MARRIKHAKGQNLTKEYSQKHFGKYIAIIRGLQSTQYERVRNDWKNMAMPYKNALLFIADSRITCDLMSGAQGHHRFPPTLAITCHDMSWDSRCKSMSWHNAYLIYIYIKYQHINLKSIVVCICACSINSSMISSCFSVSLLFPSPLSSPEFHRIRKKKAPSSHWRNFCFRPQASNPQCIGQGKSSAAMSHVKVLRLYAVSWRFVEDSKSYFTCCSQPFGPMSTVRWRTTPRVQGTEVADSFAKLEECNTLRPWRVILEQHIPSLWRATAKQVVKRDGLFFYSQVSTQAGLRWEYVKLSFEVLLIQNESNNCNAQVLVKHLLSKGQ